MSKALNDRGELTKAAKLALKAAYPDLQKRFGTKSQKALGQVLGFGQAGVSKLANADAGRPMAEAAAAALGLDLDGLLAKYGPPSPELIRLRDPRYPNLETAAAMALAELNTVLDEVFDERGLRDSDAQEYEKMLTEALHRRDHVRICVDGLAIVDDVGHVRQIDVERARVIEATPLPELCEERFREYAAHDPVRLVEIAARPALDSVSLSFLAEALGQAPWPIVGETLLVLLRHRSPLVREGALYGASAHLEHGQVKAALRRIASDFSIPELHAQASEMLDLAFARYSASPADFAALEERRRQKRESRG